MSKFDVEYKQLNPEQRKAVDTIDGPVMVIAGPGTGKTQLLSLRVANILRLTDISPNNILCLTFTDNAARNMRERLELIIGQAAFHVQIHTFHSFGMHVIDQNPDYFLERQLQQQVDDIGAYQILRELFDKLPHKNPLSSKIGDDYVFLKDTANAISWIKQNALTPKELREILERNDACFKRLSPLLHETFAISPPSPKHFSKYQDFLTELQRKKPVLMSGFSSYEAVCAEELEAALQNVSETSRYAPSVTEWRNRWCEKNSQGEFEFKDSGKSRQKLAALVDIYERFLQTMASRGLYDFDDMIMETVQTLESNDTLRANLQEKAFYILVDEFQDTNKAQLRLLKALGDNPVFENRPNILTVGDDDQAIYAFQGAAVSNLSQFMHSYKNPVQINLVENYRSTSKLIRATDHINAQILNRLPVGQGEMRGSLKANYRADEDALDYTVLPSELAQYQWIATQIKKYVASGIAPHDIAVLAPRHRYLERLVPYLAEHDVALSYERRENILDAPLIHQLLSMARMIDAMADNQHESIDRLLAEVLSFPFWEIDDETLVEISLKVHDTHGHWLDRALKHGGKTTAVVKWFISLARKSRTEPLEYVLDELVGKESLSNKDRGTFVSPMRHYYFGDDIYEKQTADYLALLGQLSTLRRKLRQWQPQKMLHVSDLVEYVSLHRQARLKIIDTNPHTQSTNAVQMMTAYKAKGLEFAVVFVINAQDEVWGPTSRSGTTKIPLPKNLPVSPPRESDNDKLRLLYVAMTRARSHLHLTGYSLTLESKPSPLLSFLVGADGKPFTGLSPIHVDMPTAAESIEILTTDWAYRFRQIIADKPTLLEPVVERYKLSVTHLNNFTDVTTNGPHHFLIHNLLRFPEAITPAAAYGDAIHKSLQWVHTQLRATNKLPSTLKSQSFFADTLKRKHLGATEYKKLETRGRDALHRYLTERSDTFKQQDLFERGFNNEGVVVGDARLSGKIDKIHFPSSGTALVVDFKTGKPAKTWSGKDAYERIKLHKYRQQLLFYKLLVEGSGSFKGKITVQGGELEFIEPDVTGKLVPNLPLTFSPKELLDFMRLVEVVWQHICQLSFPDVSHYPATLKGIQAFEKDLIDKKI